MSDDLRNFREFLGLSHERIEGMLRAAVECYGDGDLGEAERILDGLIRLEPKDARAYKLLASIHVLDGHAGRARPFFEKALELDPKDPYVLVGLAEIYLDINRFAKAMPLFERLFALDPKGEHPAANRGRMLVEHTRKKLGA